MDKFESQFDTLDVRSGHMEKAIASSTSSAVPEDEVDRLMQMVKDRAAVDKGGMIPQAGSSALGVAPAAAGADKRAVEAGPAPPAPSDSKPDDKGGAGAGAGAGAGPGAGGGGGGGGGGASLAERLAALRR